MCDVIVEQSAAAQRTIHDAVKVGNVQLLETMVKNGASVNEHETAKDHYTPLHWACHVGSLEVCYLSHLSNIGFVFCFCQTCCVCVLAFLRRS